MRVHVMPCIRVWVYVYGCMSCVREIVRPKGLRKVCTHTNKMISRHNSHIAVVLQFIMVFGPSLPVSMFTAVTSAL